MSFDEPADNQAWAEEEAFQYDLWSDNDGRTLALTYQAAESAQQTYADRVTVLLDADGMLLLNYFDASPSTNPQDVLDDCTALFGG